MGMLQHTKTGLGTMLTLLGCGATVDPEESGRCLAVSNSGYVAANQDTDGSPWSFEIQPPSISIECNQPSTNGILNIVGVVKDGKKLPIAGLSVGATVPEYGGLRLVTESNLADIQSKFKNGTEFTVELVSSDLVTDSCGVARFTLVYTCPDEKELSVGGIFTAFSGSLFSEPVQITIGLTQPETQDNSIVIVPSTQNTPVESPTPSETPSESEDTDSAPDEGA